MLLAYEYRCAICEFEGKMGLEAVALDAAHVRWWSSDGPDVVENALCLCALHHKLFDRGALSLDEKRRVLVSEQFIGHNPTSRTMVLDYAGKEALLPQKGKPPVLAEYTEWHRSEVFKGPARTA